MSSPMLPDRGLLMGMEDYRVSLRSRSASAVAVTEWVRDLPHAKPDSGVLPSQHDYYRVDGGCHVLEVEVSRTDPVDVSVRFALCNPPSVEPAFLALVRELVMKFGMDIHDPEAAEVEPWWLPPGQFEQFQESTRRAIPRRRAEWVTHFGPEQFPGGCGDAWQWVFDRERGNAPPVLVNSAN